MICHCFALRTELRGQKTKKETQSLDFTSSDTEIGVNYGNIWIWFPFNIKQAKGSEGKKTHNDLYSKTRLSLVCEGHVKTNGTATGCRVKGCQKSQAVWLPLGGREVRTWPHLETFSV